MALHAGTGKGPGHLNRTPQGSSTVVVATPALKFNVNTNSQYVPVLAL